MQSVILVSVMAIVVDLPIGSNARFAYVLSVLGNPSLLSLFGARLLFNMKEAGEHGVNEGTNWGSHTASGIRFEDGPGNDQYANIAFFVLTAL